MESCETGYGFTMLAIVRPYVVQIDSRTSGFEVLPKLNCLTLMLHIIEVN
jgi:hypothetical protein